MIEICTGGLPETFSFWRWFAMLRVVGRSSRVVTEVDRGSNANGVLVLGRWTKTAAATDLVSQRDKVCAVQRRGLWRRS